MKIIYHIIIICLLIPILNYGQLKKDIGNDKVNISNVLNSSLIKSSFLGILNPDKLKMSHSISMSYMSLGAYSAMINTYINTINYQFSDKLLLTTKLGIMNTPYNSLPNSDYLNNNQFFGGVGLKYTPTDNTVIYLSLESSPSLYCGERLDDFGNPFSISNQ